MNLLSILPIDPDSFMDFQMGVVIVGVIFFVVLGLSVVGALAPLEVPSKKSIRGELLCKVKEIPFKFDANELSISKVSTLPNLKVIL